MVSRYREELEREGGPTREAHRRTVLTAGRTALFSGLTVAVALAALVFFPQRFLYSIGVAGRRGRDPLGGDRAARRPLDARAARARGSTRSRSAAAPPSPTQSDGWYRLAGA